jgi:hypothetical protein
MLGFFRIGCAGRLDDVGALRLRCKGGAFAAASSQTKKPPSGGFFVVVFTGSSVSLSCDLDHTSLTVRLLLFSVISFKFNILRLFWSFWSASGEILRLPILLMECICNYEFIMMLATTSNPRRRRWIAMYTLLVTILKRVC